MDEVSVVAAASPYIAATTGAYGSAVIERVLEGAPDQADESVKLGSRILQALLQAPETRAALEVSILDVAEFPGDEDVLAALRLQIRRMLQNDPALLTEISGMLQTEKPAVTISEERPITPENVSAPVTTGAFNVFLNSLGRGETGRP